MHPLDNPVWHSLVGPHRTVAEGTAGAVRYAADVAPFAALPDDPSEQDWDDLATLVGRRGLAVLFRDEVHAPGGWDERFRMQAVQMVATAVVPAAAEAAFVIGPGEIAEAMELVELTQPGPFAERTLVLGTYLGVRAGGRLVALAGERMRFAGHREISAVCTHPEHRGAGHAAALVRDLVRRCSADGDATFLHVVHGNDRAVELYHALGFTDRRTMVVVGVRPG